MDRLRLPAGTSSHPCLAEIVTATKMEPMRFVVERKDLLRLQIMFCLILPILSTGCGSGKSNAVSTSSQGISGNWQMSLQPSNSKLKPTSQSGFLLDTNGVLTGGMAIQNIACPGVGNVSGSASGSNVTFTVNPGDLDIEFTGSMTKTSTMAGSYTILSTGCTGNFTAPQTGTWTANQVSPLNINIQGLFTSSHQNLNPGTFNITGKLTQGSSTGESTTSLAGTLNATGYCFFTTAGVAGTISGTSVVLNLVGSDGTQIGQINGTTSLDGSSFNGSYRMIGLGPGHEPPCVNGDTGTVTWPSPS